MCLSRLGAGFIERNSSDQTFYWLRDSDVADNVRRRGGIGLVGSDRMLKESRDGVMTVGEGVPIPDLRFAVAGVPERKDTYLRSLQQGEPQRIGTSYPELARRMYPAGSWIVTAGGSVEALPYLVDNMDAIVELVRSGESLRQNGLTIYEDNVLSVDLQVLARDGIYHKITGEMVQ
jgi:ATP phosphoribosyltransferase